MRVGSLFSGIGGLDLGLERAGMEIAWQVEIDEWCRKVLAKHWPDVPRFGDIKELSGDELEEVDLICGGFPCQPISDHGRRDGTESERWLWPEMDRIIGILQPRYVVVENIPALVRRGGAEMLADITYRGYDSEWQHIPAKMFGAPHSRERFFLFAYPCGERLWATLGPDAEHAPPPHTVWSAGENIQTWQAWLDWLRAHFQAGDWSEAPATISGMADGIPYWVDRVRGLGNAVVPQVAEWIGRRIMECSGGETPAQTKQGPQVPALKRGDS